MGPGELPAMSKSETQETEALQDELTFEQAVARLENTVQQLEEGGLELDKATALFEQGIRLARLCSERLASAELRITQIQTAYGEQMRFLPDSSADSEDEP